MKKKEEATVKTESKKAPIHTDKVGAVRASVFLNKTKDGKEFPSVVISRRYQDKDKSWKNSNSFGAKHLGELAHLVAALQSWITATYPDAAN